MKAKLQHSRHRDNCDSCSNTGSSDTNSSSNNGDNDNYSDNSCGSKC
jgi:hypothetical protein